MLLKHKQDKLMKKIYLTSAIIGAVVPYYFFYQYIQDQGLNIYSFITALFVNGAASGFTADLLLSSFVFWVYMFQQSKKENAPAPLLFIILNLTIGLSCALPAYLYAKEKPVA
jgi:hypothetical protein